MVAAKEEINLALTEHATAVTNTEVAAAAGNALLGGGICLRQLLHLASWVGQPWSNPVEFNSE